MESTGRMLFFLGIMAAVALGTFPAVIRSDPAEQPMDRSERNAMLASQAYARRVELLISESHYRDDLYIDTKENHAWCGEQLKLKLRELDAVRHGMAVYPQR